MGKAATLKFYVVAIVVMSIMATTIGIMEVKMIRNGLTSNEMVVVDDNESRTEIGLNDYDGYCAVYEEYTEECEFELLDEVRMYVDINVNGEDLHRAYIYGNDGFTYLVEVDEEGTVKRDSNGEPNIIQRCDFADLYLD